MPVYDEAGRGRKSCPNCNHYVGARSAKCEQCGHSFGTTEVVVRHSLPTDIRQVGIPAGECPVTLKGTDTETVLEWADKVRDAFLGRRQNLQVSGLVYFARYFFDINGPEFKTVKATLVENFTEGNPEDEGNEF